MTLICTLLTLGSGVSHAAMLWQPAAPQQNENSTNQGHAGHRAGKMLHLFEGGDAEVELWLPSTVRRPLKLNESDIVRIGGTGVDNYHLLLAKKQSEDREEVALRYLYQHGKPSGLSPSTLIERQKSTLEIVPAPLTREHQRYLSGQPFHFLIHFDGRPLINQQVILSTNNGSRLQGSSDEEGRITFHLPDDFSSIKPGRRSNPPAEFVLSVSHQQHNRHYQTTLSAPYYVNPSHWRSTGGALAAMFAGVFTGLVVLRRSRKDSTGQENV